MIKRRGEKDMCNFKSGIIFKDRVEIDSDGIESHSRILEKLGVEDSTTNAYKMFVRAELLPLNGDRVADISKWRFKVDQDMVPDWFENDQKYYELEFRNSVKKWLADNFVEICGHLWTPIKRGNHTYHFMYDVIPLDRFGKNNNYAESDAKEKLENGELNKRLKKQFGDKLLSPTVDLTAMDGCKDYGKVECDGLAPIDVHTLMEFGDEIPLVDKTYFLANPNQTPKRGDTRYVRYVDSNGNVRCNVCRWFYGVRPFFILQS